MVFFCGAGISTPAGLPLFKGLVDEIYTQLNTYKTTIEAESYRQKQYDATFAQLEQRYPGQRQAVRLKLTTILEPKWRKRGATTTHQALLQLATDRKKSVRIVTTNFDHIFQRVIKRKKLDVPVLAAPFLPVPKPSRWHGVVHLHGLLPKQSDDERAMDRLVISSGDFGLAYLTEGWAARFVSELFRNYIVCFIGYGINDPVLRYMIDALAADGLLGEKTKKTYAFASFQEGEKEEALRKWKAKGVTPLLYKASSSALSGHSALHNTLKEWANTYRDGVRGKEMIISQHANTPPLAPSNADFVVGRMLWALTDSQAAKHFADLNPVPPIEWLEPLSENQFKHQDLFRFGVSADNEEDEELSFSILHRPAPYIRSPWMNLVNSNVPNDNWDGIMFHLARWLTRHLNNPKLILWVAKNGGCLHDQWTRLIRQRLRELEQLRTKGKQERLDEIHANAPNAIPEPAMRTLWRLALAKRLKPHTQELAFSDWFDCLKQDGITPSLRMELRAILRPYVALQPLLDWGEKLPEPANPPRISDLVQCEIALSCTIDYTLRRRAEHPEWHTALPHLLQDFTLLLHDALDLEQELGHAGEKHDISYVARPSISQHQQNAGADNWTILIELVRDAWLATAKTNYAKARHVAEDWWRTPYPIFKRLALFAATRADIISQRKALSWLLAENGWWLWSIGTQRESLRLLAALVPRLNATEIKELERAVLDGPPREMFKSDLDQDGWKRIVNSSVWLRLSKIQATGRALSEKAKNKLSELTQQYPNRQLAEDESDEFPVAWVKTTGSDQQKLSPTPREHNKLLEWARTSDSREPDEGNTWHLHESDDWRQRCSNDFATVVDILSTLAQQKMWPVYCWRIAFQVWSDEEFSKSSWECMAPTLKKAPDDFLQSQSLIHSFSRWLESIAKTVKHHNAIFWGLCRRVISIDSQRQSEREDVDYPNITDIDPVANAINEPIGHVTEALLSWWYEQKPKDQQGLPSELKEIFTKLCSLQADKFRHGRVLLAAHVISLYRVDCDWTTKHLLPFFDWQQQTIEARSVWEGFLWSPRLYHPLLSAMKEPILETTKYYESLGSHKRQYISFLTYIALDKSDIFTDEELASSTENLPSDGLENTVQTLIHTLEGSKNQRTEYWNNRILPYLQRIWPKSNKLRTPAVSSGFAHLCLAAEEEFPSALEELQYWLQPVKDLHFLLGQIIQKNICEKFPNDALKFLDTVIADDTWWSAIELKQCLEKIKQADPELISDYRLIRLANLAKRDT